MSEKKDDDQGLTNSKPKSRMVLSLGSSVKSLSEEEIVKQARINSSKESSIGFDRLKFDVNEVNKNIVNVASSNEFKANKHKKYENEEKTIVKKAETAIPESIENSSELLHKRRVENVVNSLKNLSTGTFTIDKNKNEISRDDNTPEKKVEISTAIEGKKIFNNKPNQNRPKVAANIRKKRNDSYQTSGNVDFDFENKVAKKKKTVKHSDGEFDDNFEKVAIEDMIRASLDDDLDYDNIFGGHINIVEKDVSKTQTRATNQYRPKRVNRQRRGRKSVAKKEISIYGEMSIEHFANVMAVRKDEIVSLLKNMGYEDVKYNFKLDIDTMLLIAEEYGSKITVLPSDLYSEIEVEYNDLILKSKEIKTRIPVVAIVGHIDHGKTSLLDAIRGANVAEKETGGITQKVSGYTIKYKENKITFIDTPGHKIFSGIRKQGINAADVILLIIAADDGVMEQTKQSIEMLQELNITPIVVINKIDKPEANILKIEQELARYGIIVESLGGDVVSVQISAKNRTNLDELLETILLQSEMLELKSSYDIPASGYILESSFDQKLGIYSDVIISNGCLKSGDVLMSGNAYCKLRIIEADIEGVDPKKDSIEPGSIVKIYGFSDYCHSGSYFISAKNEKIAKKAVEERVKNERNNKVQNKSKDIMLEDFFSESNQKKKLNLFIYADSKGSLDSIVKMVSDIKCNEVDIVIIGSQVGQIKDFDATTIAKSGAEVMCFNTGKQSPKIISQLESAKIKIRNYDIVYNLVDDLKDIINNLIDPVIEEKKVGEAKVLAIFDTSKAGRIYGCMVSDGFVEKDFFAKIIRKGKLLFSSKINNLRRMKDDVKTVRNGYECGIQLNSSEEVLVGDVIEVYQQFSIKKNFDFNL